MPAVSAHPCWVRCYTVLPIPLLLDIVSDRDARSGIGHPYTAVKHCCSFYPPSGDSGDVYSWHCYLDIVNSGVAFATLPNCPSFPQAGVTDNVHVIQCMYPNERPSIPTPKGQFLQLNWFVHIIIICTVKNEVGIAHQICSTPMV